MDQMAVVFVDPEGAEEGQDLFITGVAEGVGRRRRRGRREEVEKEGRREGVVVVGCLYQLRMILFLMASLRMGEGSSTSYYHHRHYYVLLTIVFADKHSQ